MKSVVTVRHEGVNYRAGSWAASSSGLLIYMSDVIAVTDNYWNTDFKIKMFPFSLLEQLRATIEPGRIVVRLARMLQLVKEMTRRLLCGEVALADVDRMPVPTLSARSGGSAWWRWRCCSFTACARDKHMFRPIHFAGLDPTGVQLQFVFR